MKKIILLILCLPFYLNAEQIKRQSFDSEQYTFVLKSESSGEYELVNEERSEQPMTPWSTFKIANSLIALDLGVVKDLEQSLTFDLTKYPIQSWWLKRWYEKPLCLSEAFKYSAVPIYQEIASEISNQKMQKYLDKFNYGNRNISSGIDAFWLNGSLKISAKEQVSFLQKFNEKQLPVSRRASALLKEIMLVEETESYKLYAKTGGGHLQKGQVLGWYVGFVENKEGVHYFALNIEGTQFRDIMRKRKSLVKEHLSKAGVLN